MPFQRDAVLRVKRTRENIFRLFLIKYFFAGYCWYRFCLHKSVRYIYTSMFSRMIYISIHIRVLLVPWLPESYAINQLVFILLGLWAIVERDSAFHIEVVCI